MLTLRFSELRLKPGDLFLDAGAGFGRHAFEAARQGVRVVALDYANDEVIATRNTFAAMAEAGEINVNNFVACLRGDATKLPFADNSFDCIVTSEVLEHIHADVSAIAELTRILKPGGTLGVTVPTWWPEKINWMLSDEYYAPKSVGGHVRIYSATELKAKLRSAGLTIKNQHHAHALHSPYWWLRCAVGPRNESNKAVAAYRKFLEWDIMKKPKSTRVAERLLNPVLGKSFIVYARKPLEATQERAQEKAAS